MKNARVNKDSLLLPNVIIFLANMKRWLRLACFLANHTNDGVKPNSYIKKIEARYWRYFGVHSHNLGPIKESAPRIVNLNIDEFNIGFDSRL